MSKQPVIADTSPVARLAGYYGKIPLAGDFVMRRTAHDTLSIWDNWLRQGLLAVKNAGVPTENVEQRQTPMWNFVAPPSVCGAQLIGLICESRDRVGRHYPFTLFESLELRTSGQFRLDHVTPFFMRHAPIIRALQLRQMSIDQLESALEGASDWQFPGLNSPSNVAESGDIFAVLGRVEDDDETTVAPPLGGLLPWPGMDLAEVMQGDTSYWWTNQTLGGPLRAFTHTGGLNETLFKILFAPLKR
jgi:type VI secretion system protein ImpM